MIFNFKGLSYDLSKRTHVMGILNITPDSFSDGGKYFQSEVLIDRVVEDAIKMEKEGADFIDIGGESTRPGSESITIEEELNRVIPVISSLYKKISIPLSIDTYKSEVAEEALKAGAQIVNDITGFKFDKKIAQVTANHGAGCVLMHIKGTPKDMQKDPAYDNVTEEVFEYLKESVSIAKDHGIDRIITDVGIGFGKTLEHNLELIRNLRRFRDLGCPVLLGVSRKSFIDKISKTDISERLEGTIAANVIGIMNGANVIRVHDVKQNIKAAKVADKILSNKE